MPRRPHKTDEEIIQLAQRLKAKYGIVTVSALRAAAGGGSPNRIKKLIEAMPEDTSSAREETSIIEADEAGIPDRKWSGKSSTAEGQADSDFTLARLTARLEALQDTQDHLMDLLREDRQGRRGEIETLNRLVERQNSLIDHLGQMMELALKTTQNDLQAMREEFNQVAHRMAAPDSRRSEQRH